MSLNNTYINSASATAVRSANINTFVLLVPPPGQQLRDFMLDEVQQFDGVGHPQHQWLQTWDQLLHAEQLKMIRLPIIGAPDVKTQQGGTIVSNFYLFSYFLFIDH